jgi:AsmA protein
MKKILKYGLLGLAIVLVLIVGAIGYFMTTFDPNAYKPQIIQAVKDKQNRTLKLDGDIKLTIFPSIGAKLDNISLSEFNSDKEFASITSAHVSLAVLPLLSKQVVVSEVGLSGVKLSVVKFRDGTTNLDDLIGKKEAKEEPRPEAETKPGAAVKFDIAGVKIEKTELSYRDESTGAQYSIKDLNLKTGRIANGIPGKIDFDAVVQANKPALDIAANLHTTLTFDLDKKFYQIEGLDMQIKGTALDISNLMLKATGSASANLATQEFTAKKLAISATGVKGKDNFNASLDMPALTFTKDKVAAEKLLVNANLDGEMGKIIAALSLLDMQGNAMSFKSSALILDVDFKQPQQAFKLKLSTPLVGSLDAKQINLSNLVFAVNATGDKLPGKSVSSEMKGSVQLDGGRESLQLNLAGGLLQSQVKAKLAVKGFAEPAIRFDAEADQFDADLYLPKKSAVASAKTEPAPEQPFDLSALQKLTLDGSLRIGSLKVANVKSSKLRIDVKANKGQVNISPLSANLYQGSINGSIAVNAAQATPTFAVKQNLSGVQLGPLIKDAADFDVVEGKGNVTLNLTTQGNTVTALKKGLNGSAALNLVNGAIKGVNLTKLVRGAQNLGQAGGVQTLKPSPDDKTEFSELKASFKVSNGVAHNDDLLVKSPSLKVSGKGDVDIGNSTINYSTKTTLAEAVDGKSGSLTVPVQLNGPFADLKFKVDYGAVVADVVKQKVDAKIESKKEELKQQLQEKLKGGLKDLLK